MQQDNIVNKIIPADDLYWCDEDQKFVTLSKKEVDSLIKICIYQQMKEEEVYKVISWASIARTGEILLKNLLENKVQVVGFHKDEPLFGAKNYDN